VASSTRPPSSNLLFSALLPGWPFAIATGSPASFDTGDQTFTIGSATTCKLLRDPIWIVDSAAAVELAAAVALGDLMPQVRRADVAAEPLDQR
jgi:hypothetical protein